MALDESIQQLIKAMRATQHGDRTNEFYDITQDFHMEGGVWKHTLLAIDALPTVAKGLANALEDPNYVEVYNKFKNTLRSTALYHDIGKITTQVPSKKRTGSYSFPQHSAKEVVTKAFDTYDISPDSFVVELVSHHHDSPAEVNTLENYWDKDQIKMLMILKAADNMAVGPRGSYSAVNHVVKFMIAMENKVSKQGLPLTNEWGIEDVEWAKGSELGFIQPEKEIAGNHVAGEIGGEPGEEEVVGLNSTGEREVVLTISTRL